MKIIQKKQRCLLFAVVCLLTRATSINFTKQNTISQVDRISKHLSSFIFSIGRRYFKEKEVIYVLVPKDEDEMGIIFEGTVKSLVNSWTIFTKEAYCCDQIIEKFMPFTNTYHIQTYQVPTTYIIPFNLQKGFKYFETQIRILQKPNDFNPRAIFLIILLTEEFNEIRLNKVDKRIFNFMWKNNLFQTTLLLLSKTKQITVGYAKPFSAENQCRTVMEQGIYFFNSSKASELSINLNYEETIDLQKCYFVIGTIPLPPYVVGKQTSIENKIHYDYIGGIEIELLHLLSQLMNFRYKFHKTHSYRLDAWFTKLPNGTIIGILQDLLDHNIDMAFGGFIPDYITYYKYDYSTSYKFSSICCYVTDPNFIPQWMIFFVTFSNEVWIFSILAFFTVSTLYFIMERLEISGNRIETEAKQKNIVKEIHFANFFRINLGMSSVMNPTSGHLRVLLFSWAIYCVHWYSAYTSILFTYITNPPLEKEIRTIHDLKESGLKVSLDITYQVIFKHNGLDKLAKSVLDNHVACANLIDCVQQFVRDRNFSVMDKAEAIEYLVNVKQYKVHRLTQNMMTYFVSTITTRGNPLSLQFSKMALRAFEDGLLQKWEKDVRLQYHYNKGDAIPSGDDHSTPLTMKDLIGSFLLLILGLIISFILYIGEIINYQCLRGRNGVKKL